MTQSLAPHTPELSLAERVRRALAKNQAVSGGAGASPPPPRQSSVLLLDCSGSMEEPGDDPRVRKIDALRAVVADMHLPASQAMFAFASSVDACTTATIPEPRDMTYMCRAFRRAKAGHHTAAVIITDGCPSDPDAALREARGLKLEIFYIGPAPKPRFLDQLARACGGQAHQSGLRKDQRKQLASRVRGLLEAPK